MGWALWGMARATAATLVPPDTVSVMPLCRSEVICRAASRPASLSTSGASSASPGTISTRPTFSARVSVCSSARRPLRA